MFWVQLFFLVLTILSLIEASSTHRFHKGERERQRESKRGERGAEVTSRVHEQEKEKEKKKHNIHFSFLLTGM